MFSVDVLLMKNSQQNVNTGCWQWRDDRSTWHNYLWVDNRILEASFQSGEDEISLSTLGRNYIIDFTNMQQVCNFPLLDSDQTYGPLLTNLKHKKLQLALQ